jgi:hypothetical protein
MLCIQVGIGFWAGSPNQYSKYGFRAPYCCFELFQRHWSGSLRNFRIKATLLYGTLTEQNLSRVYRVARFLDQAPRPVLSSGDRFLM